MTDVHVRLEEIARSVFHDDSLVLHDSTTSSDVARWDSHAHVRFVFAVEAEFDVLFSDDEFVGFADIGELKQILARKLGA